jgi:isopenicillin-N N-acyltransferase-like protein
MHAMLELPIVRLAGTPAEMGLAYGRALREPISAFVAQRVRAAKVYLYERGIRDDQALRNLGAQCLAKLEQWHRDGWVEHHATAEGAGVDPIDLYTTGNMTDVRDILVLGAISAESEGCTTAHAGRERSASGEVIAAQTWDLNPTDLDYVVAVHRRPASGPQTWSVTCAGCPSLVGMNEHGVAVGTTNIKTRGSRVGIPYLSLLHRMLAVPTRAQAEQALLTAPRAAAHTYWIADAEGVTDLECTATDAVRRETGSAGFLSRTNHCLDGAHRTLEGEPATASSQKRLARSQAVLAAGGVTVAAVRALFADRSDGVDSINRFGEDGQGTSTNACIITVPAQRRLHACRGSADRGAWVELAF